MYQEMGFVIYPGILATAVILVLVSLRALVFKALQRWARSTNTELDDIIIKSIKVPSFFWCIAIALYAGLALSDMPARYIAWTTKSIYVLVLLSVTAAAATLAGRLFEGYIKKSTLPIPSTGLMQGVIRGTILLLGTLVTLSSMGISIAPLLTAMGVGGLAVALAIQDTLSNLFSGIHIIMEGSIRVGDFVKLESGQEGYVEDINWRTTRIRMLPNNMVIIPNSKLSQSVFINYYLPEKRMSLLVPISVSYSSDPDKVERILIEEANRCADRIPGLLKEPAPFVMFIPGFGESSLDFTLICQVAEFVEQYLAQHELRKAIFKRFQEEGIEIPFPQRTVHLKEARA